MKRFAPVLTAILSLMFVLAVATAPASAAKGNEMSGTWKCIAHGGSQGDTPFTLYLQQNGSTVTGSVSSSLGDAPITSASFKQNVLQIEIDGDGNSYQLKAKYSQGALSGDWSNTEGEKGNWTGKKESGESH